MIRDWEKHTRAISKKMDDFVNNVMFEGREYTFFDKKKKTAVCSKCGKEYTLDFNINHNDLMCCPYCGDETIAKSIGYGRKGLENKDCLYWFYKSKEDPKALVCCGYLIRKDYEDYKKPKIYHELEAVYIFGDKESAMWRYDYWGRGLVRRSSIFDFNIWSLCKYFCYIDRENLKEAIKGTYIEYANWDDYGTNCSIVNILNKYTKYPWIEQIYKAGFTSIAKEVIEGKPYARTLNFRGKNIYDVLKLSKGQVKNINRQKVNTPLLRLYQEKEKTNDKITYKDIDEMYNKLNWVGYIEDFIKCSKYSSMRKLNKYLSYQTDKNDESFQNSIVTYKDYISSAKFLKIDIKDRHILFPKNIFKAHDNLNKQIKLKKDAILDEKIKKRVPKLNKYRFDDGNYLIRPLLNAEEIIDEGKKLDHCVATHYMEPYAKGTCIILGVRKKEEESKPLVTVEVRNGSIRQAYGIHDTKPPEEVLEFLDKYKQEILVE